MSAREDYPEHPYGGVRLLVDTYEEMCDEIDRLRSELNEMKRLWRERDNAAAIAEIQLKYFKQGLELICRSVAQEDHDQDDDQNEEEEAASDEDAVSK